MVKNNDSEEALNKSTKCTKTILAAKEKYINELSRKLGSSGTGKY